MKSSLDILQIMAIGDRPSICAEFLEEKLVQGAMPFSTRRCANGAGVTLSLSKGSG
ncbi:MAG: hypothetical protein ACYTX0_47490 [Nostoc sp.]